MEKCFVVWWFMVIDVINVKVEDWVCFVVLVKKYYVFVVVFVFFIDVDMCYG